MPVRFLQWRMEGPRRAESPEVRKSGSLEAGNPEVRKPRGSGYLSK